MLELVLLLIIISAFALIKVEKGVMLFFVLLPFHAFVKNFFVFFFQAGGIFSNWKELVLIILLGKIFLLKRKLFLTKNLMLLFYVFLAYLCIVFLGTKNLSNALNPLRNHLFFIVVFLVFSNVKINFSSMRGFVLFPMISFLISYLMGFVQLFLLKIPLGFYMGRIAGIDPSGYIFYTTNSARILGFERMAGIIGGPNDFGLFVAISLLFSIIILTGEFGYRKSKSLLLFSYITMSIGFIALIYSFSRAGWAIFFGSLIIFLITKKIKIRISFIIIGIVALLGFFVFVANTDIVQDVYQKTVSGEEASSADRLNNVSSGLSVIFDKPWGNGLGTTNNQDPTAVEFFAESATINIIYELGFIGYFLLVMIFVVIGVKTYLSRNDHLFARLSLAVISVTFVASFVSVNTYGMPYILMSWACIGLGVNPNFSNKVYLTE